MTKRTMLVVRSVVAILVLVAVVAQLVVSIRFDLGLVDLPCSSASTSDRSSRG